MSVIVACPKCQSRYQLPVNAVGKQVQCKKCGHKFAASPVVSPQVQGAVKAPAPATSGAAPAARTPVATSASVAARPANTIPSASAAALAKFGLDGPIQRQAEILSDLPSPPPRDILGNLAADPGFVSDEQIAEPKSGPAVGGEEDLSSIVNNPYASQGNDRVVFDNSKGGFKNLHWPVKLTKWGAWGISFSLLAFFLAAGLETGLVSLGVTAVPRVIWLFLRLGVFSWMLTVPVCSMLFMIGLTWSTFASSCNLRTLGVESLRYGTGLLTASWFIPIMNLFWPFLGLGEIVRASKKPFSPKWNKQKFPGNVMVAWITLILTIFAGFAIFFLPVLLLALGLVEPEKPEVLGYIFIGTFVLYCALGGTYMVVLADMFEKVHQDQELAFANPPKKRR